MRFLSVFNYLIDQAVLCRFLGGHEVIPFTVGGDNFHRLAGIVCQDAVHPLLDYFQTLEMDESRNAPIEAAIPIQMVETSHLMYCMVS